MPRDFQDLWQLYLQHSKEFNGRAWYDSKRYTGGRYFREWFGRAINEITPMEIEAHLIERRKKSARSANLDFEILRNLFKWCEQMGFIDRSPMSPLRTYPRNKKTRIIPTKADVEALISANEGTDKLLILLLVYTMGRISEIKGLQWKDVDLSKKVLYLRTRKTRDGSETIRELPISGLLASHLMTAFQGFPYVLSNVNGQPYRDLRKRLARCFQRAGFDSTKKIGFHQFRHFGATQLADLGVPLNVIQDLLGHTTLDTTNIYLQSLTESKRKAMELL